MTMLTALVLSLAAIPQDRPTIEARQSWFGPATVAFSHDVTGSPYDPIKNNFTVRFTPASGAALDRLAYWDDGQWKATLLAPIPGTYTARLLRNGQPTTAPEQRVSITEEMRQDRRFVRIDPDDRTRFVRDGRPFFPLGINLGWQTPGLPDMTDQMKKMADNGMNWARIWACSWDGKNPYLPNDPANKVPIGLMWPPALQRWDQLVAAAEKNDLVFQFVLFHHGQVSSTVNSNWDINPWNAANGGFLTSPVEFFRHPEAKKWSKAWLRYAVARWGHSPSVMAWELFNEVEWVDAWRDGPRELVYEWHKEMAEYLRSIDHYGRLVTTSSEMAHPELYAAMDYYQPHGYPPSVFNMIAGAQVPKDKPYFWGEFGPGDSSDQSVREAVRDGIWASITRKHSGAAQYWYWDIVERQDLYPEFRRAHEALKALSPSNAALSRTAAEVPVEVRSDASGDLVLRPGRGWGKTERHLFELPADAIAERLNQLSEFLNSHTGGNRELNPQPLELRFRLRNAGQATFAFGQAARNGAELRIEVNGAVAVERKWEPAERDRPAGEPSTVPLTAGENVIKISSVGPDWVTLRSVKIEGLGPAVRAQAVRDGGRTLVRITRLPGAPDGPLQVTLGRLGLDQGEITVRTLDLDSGEWGTARVVHGAEGGKYLLAGRDVALVFP